MCVHLHIARHLILFVCIEFLRLWTRGPQHRGRRKFRENKHFDYRTVATAHRQYKTRALKRAAAASESHDDDLADSTCDEFGQIGLPHKGSCIGQNQLVGFVTSGRECRRESFDVDVRCIAFASLSSALISTRLSATYDLNDIDTDNYYNLPDIHSFIS